MYIHHVKNDCERNITYKGSNWACQIKTFLVELGMNDVWENQNNINFNIASIKQRIFDIYLQSWYSDINNSRRLHYYSIYKHSFFLENYLNSIKIKKYRVALTKFRLSSHDLEIERGRYTNISTEERICRQCTMNVIETEYHFLLVCPKFLHLRKQFLKPYFTRWPNLTKFEQLMSSTNNKTQFNLSRYLYEAFNFRTTI